MSVDAAVPSLISLRKVLPDAQFLGADDILARACSCDAGQAPQGAVYVAMAGKVSCDGTRVQLALERGCEAVVSDRPLADVAVPVCVVPDAQAAYARICQALAGDPSRTMKVIGVGGTLGRTTTGCLIAGILRAAGQSVGMIGALGYLDGREVLPAAEPTPPPERLAGLLAAMASHGCSHVVMEMSGQALAKSWAAGVALDAVCVPSVRDDLFADATAARAYAAARRRLLSLVEPDRLVVLNADDAGSTDCLRTMHGPTLTVGIDKPADIRAVVIEQSLSEQTFLLIAGSETTPVRTRIAGTSHIYRCLSAAAVGLAYGIDVPTVARGLESIDYVPGRMERIECGQPFGVFVDAAHTPYALAELLETLRPLVAGRLICAIGAEGERNRSARPHLGRVLATRADLAVLTSDDPRGEDPREIIASVLEGFAAPEDVKVLLDRKRAIRWALSQARQGDCVVLAGRANGWDPTDARCSQVAPDREIVRRWLQSPRRRFGPGPAEPPRNR